MDWSFMNEELRPRASAAPVQSGGQGEEYEFEDEDDPYCAFEAPKVEEQAPRVEVEEDIKWEKVLEKQGAPAGGGVAAGGATKECTRLLMKEMRALLKLGGTSDTPSIEVEMMDDDLRKWKVKLNANGFPDDAPLQGDLLKYAADFGRDPCVLLNVHFPPQYPFSPPFLRVVRPRFQFHTGHITVGGSICMELLTSAGWMPSYSVEAVLVQLKADMVAGGGRVDFRYNHDYTYQEAQEAFDRVARQHGWV